jgi:hypothetical protein
MSFKKMIPVGDGGYFGPYIVMAQLRFPDGLSLSIFGDATSRAQQDQMLAAIRTIHRMAKR